MGSLTQRDGVCRERKQLAYQAVGSWSLVDVPGWRFIKQELLSSEKRACLRGRTKRVSSWLLELRRNRHGNHSSCVTELRAGHWGNSRCPRAPLGSLLQSAF